MATYECVICRRAVDYAGPLPELYPFCSPRCRLVDLGQWLREGYTIYRDVTPDDLPERPRRADDASG
jgi:uncharacterized protein